MQWSNEMRSEHTQHTSVLHTMFLYFVLVLVYKTQEKDGINDQSLQVFLKGELRSHFL